MKKELTIKAGFISFLKILRYPFKLFFNFLKACVNEFQLDEKDKKKPNRDKPIPVPKVEEKLPLPPVSFVVKNKPASNGKLLDNDWVCGDLESFIGSSWLTQTHLYRYISHLAKSYLQLSDFYPGSPVFVIHRSERYQQSIDKTLLSQLADNAQKPVSEQKTVFAYPLHLSENHWGLVLVDTKKRTLEYYDSKGTYSDSYYDEKGTLLEHSKDHEAIKKHFQKIAQSMSAQELGAPYRFMCKTNTCLQPDSYECGPWVLYFIEQRLKNPDIDFGHLRPIPNMADYRLEVLHHLALEDKYNHRKPHLYPGYEPLTWKEAVRLHSQAVKPKVKFG